MIIGIEILMEGDHFWKQNTCSDCRRIRCHQGCNCDCHWNKGT
jgi:hypothetical protein